MGSWIRWADAERRSGARTRPSRKGLAVSEGLLIIFIIFIIIIIIIIIIIKEEGPSLERAWPFPCALCRLNISRSPGRRSNGAASARTRELSFII